MLVEVAGVRVPVGPAAEAARTVCTEYADDALYHHSVRSYFFGAAWVGAGTRPRLRPRTVLRRGNAARPRSHPALRQPHTRLRRGRRTPGPRLGWPTERRDRAAELIVLHMRDDVAPEVDTESRLLQIGTSADVSGTGLEAFDSAFRDTLIDVLPVGPQSHEKENPQFNTVSTRQNPLDSCCQFS